MMRQPGKILNPAKTSECPIDDTSTRKRSLAAPFAACLSIAIISLFPVVAQAISFGLEYRDSTYQVVGSDTYDDLVLEFQSGTLLSTQTIGGLDGLTSTVYAGTNNDYATLITTTFIAGVTGTYEFQVGTDWGRGGGAQAVHVGSGTVLDSTVTTDDIWWGNNWGNPDVFSTVLNLTAGETYSLGWVGFEDCCGGAASFRFSIDGSAPQILNSTNFLPFEQPSPVPEPGAALLVGLGLAWLSVLARTGKKTA